MFERIEIKSDCTAVMIVFVPKYQRKIPTGLSWLGGFGQVRIGGEKFQKVDSATMLDENEPYMAWTVRRCSLNVKDNDEKVFIEYIDTKSAGGRQNHLN